MATVFLAPIRIAATLDTPLVQEMAAAIGTEGWAKHPLGAEVDVSNTSDGDGDKVVEVYLNYPKLKGAPVRARVGFTRIHVLKRATRHVRIDLGARDLSTVNEDGIRITAPDDYRVSVGGGSWNGGPGCGVDIQYSARSRPAGIVGRVAIVLLCHLSNRRCRNATVCHDDQVQAWRRERV